MLIGSYNHTIDDKSRVTVPAKWRQDLGAGFVLTRGVDGAILGMSFEEWERLSAKLAAMPVFTDKKAQNVRRNLTRWASECEMDKQGRVVISQQLRTFAHIETEVVLIGTTNHFEIWSAAVLDAHDEAEEDDYDEILAGAAEFGI